jgi:hypothetical protein
MGMGERIMMFMARRGEDSVTERVRRKGVAEDTKPFPTKDRMYGRESAKGTQIVIIQQTYR